MDTPRQRLPRLPLRRAVRWAFTLSAVLLLLAGALAVTASDTLARAPRQRPLAIRIDKIDVHAPVEVRTTVRGQMQDPTGPDVVSWYDDTARPGSPGNVVVAGHYDFAGVGPAVFARLGELERGDLIILMGEDGGTYKYRVVGTSVYGAENGPWDDLTGPTRKQSLTLITCAPPWDVAAGHYVNRLVVRAVRVRN